MENERTRRDFLVAGAASLLTGSASAGQSPAHHQHGPDHEFPRNQPGPSGPVGSSSDRGKLVSGRRSPELPPVPVETPDLPKLFWEMKGGVKEFHLHCRHLRREFLPDMWFDVWGFNNSMPGPMIEAVEGDRVRAATIRAWACASRG